MTYALKALMHYATMCYDRGIITVTEYHTILRIIIDRSKNNHTVH